jgi:predicted CXXCH cytochrome family protein
MTEGGSIHDPVNTGECTECHRRVRGDQGSLSHRR